MKQEVVLAPDIILNPVSLSLNLIAFCKDGKRIGIPLAWLWKEIDMRIADHFGLISVADDLAYYSGKYVPFDEKIWFKWEDINRGLVNDFDKFSTSMAILKTAYELGFVEGFITEYDKWYFKHGMWNQYLLEIVPEYKIIPFDKPMMKDIYLRSSKAICKKYRITRARLGEIIKRNEDFSTRVASEFPIYEDFCRLHVEIGQIFSACFNQYAISSSNEHVRTLIATRLQNELKPIDLEFQDEKILPFLEIVKLDPYEFTIRDVAKIIENRSLLDKLGGMRAAIRKIEEVHGGNEFKKNMLLYILGWVPILDIPVKVFQGADLILEKVQSIRRQDRRSCVYFNVNSWKKDYEKLRKVL